MKPLRLEFAAFGPFVERQVIDFTTFADTGVFLIHGETGAGKTVILDAMTYALYGKSSGGVRGDMAAMRCQFADVTQPTEVLFEFALNQKRYRFTRGLKMRKKRDGSMEYLPQQDVFYQEENGTYVPFFENPRIRDVEEKAQELLGLGYEQFIQVVILPQGKFERLLLAKSEEKEKILVSLFQADRWQQTAERMCREVNEQKRELEQQQLAVQQGLAQFDCTDFETMRQYAEQKRAHYIERQQQQEVLFQQWEQQTQRLQQARVVEQMFCNLEEKEKQWKRLQLRHTEMRELERKLQKAKKLQLVMPLYEQHRQERERAARLRTQRNELLEQMETVRKETEEWNERAVRLETGRASYEKLRETLQRNETMEQQYTQMKEAERAQKETALQCEQLQERRSKCRERYEGLQKEKETALLVQQMVAVDYIAKIPLYRQELKSLERLRKEEQNRERLRQQWETAQAESAALQQETAETEERYQKAMQAQNKNLASRLAEQLQDGAPCPVCGSIHHPVPAVPDDEMETADVETLRDQAARAREAFLLAVQSAEMLQKSMQQTAETNADNRFSKERYAECLAALQRAETEEARQPHYAAAVASVTERLEACRNEEIQLEEQYRQAVQEKETAEREYIQICAQNGGVLPDMPALQATINWQKKEVKRFEAEQQLVREKVDAYRLQAEGLQASGKLLQQETEQAEAGEKAAQTALERKLQEVQLEWNDTLPQAVMDSSAMETAETALRNYQTECQICEQAMAEYQKKLEPVARPDIMQLEREEQTLQEQHLACVQEVSVRKEEVQRVEEAYDTLKKAADWLRSREAAWQQNQLFAHMLRGDSGVSLQRYVLGVMLSSIIAEANKMLQQVHDGRYRLLRTMDTTGRTRKAGLELEVFDHRTGMRRGVASLSGGEKFLVSLSLSLGLSSVVQMGCGGIRLQAMFIDEGFGTLDESSIADALQILTQIRHTGGMVGVISHVQVLKENIHCGIEVNKYHNGSKLRMIY